MLCRSKDPLKVRSAFSKSVIAKQALLKHKWLRLDPEGTTAVLQTGKHALTQRLGVQARNAAPSPMLNPIFIFSPAQTLP
jgi:hypothetical protein